MKIYKQLNDISNWKKIKRKDKSRLGRHLCNMVIASGSFNMFVFRTYAGLVPFAAWIKMGLLMLGYNVWYL